jgi:hypothetical protein
MGLAQQAEVRPPAQTRCRIKQQLYAVDTEALAYRDKSGKSEFQQVCQLQCSI